MSRIDYSKWDKIDLSEDEETTSAGKCRVTRFDSPKSVTIGKRSNEQPLGLTVEDSRKSEPKEAIGHISTDKGLKLQDFVSSCIPGENKHYYWTQTETNIIILLEISPNVTAKDLRLDVTEDSLTIFVGEGVYFSETFLYQVNNNEDTIFWSIRKVQDSSNKSCFKRMVSIELEKKVLDSSLRLWWKSLFKNGPEVDVQRFRTSSVKECERNRQFMDAWKQAHEEFRSTVRKPKVQLQP